ncbi:MAG: Uracil DNA glycosylase superfamily protein [Syntrophorhabdus sp. PtaU1.Bin050]|jgi:DNA polymerase|nr:MAG: Uracil DNA glycosylase superfamily protein [Syntrophorhabdus sp. PtaU1.Bin050]
MSFVVNDLNVKKFLSALKGMGIDSYVSNSETMPTLPVIQKTAKACRKCDLANSRRNVVFGEGNDKAQLVFVGEAPGEEEDRLGRPFVGRAGKLLDQLIEKIGLRREDVYICNVLKCRPPNNRDPEEAEIDACKPYLLFQLELIRPKVICTLGRHAYNTLFNVNERITRVRGVLRDYKGTMLLPTYHPSFLLRNQEKIKEAWEDMERLKQLLRS